MKKGSKNRSLTKFFVIFQPIYDAFCLTDYSSFKYKVGTHTGMNTAQCALNQVFPENFVQVKLYLDFNFCENFSKIFPTFPVRKNNARFSRAKFF